MDTDEDDALLNCDCHFTKEAVMNARITLVAIPMTLSAMASPAVADSHDGLVLHVDDSYSECFFDLHPELTQSEFDTFAKEGSVVMHDLQLASAAPIGRHQWEVSLDYSRTVIDETKGAWNNTMSHPAADHWLGNVRAFPRLSARYGITQRVDVGLTGTLDPNANYGFLGAQSKVTLFEQDESMPVSIAVRPTVMTLLGPKELFVVDAGADVSVSRNYKGLAPYVGFAAHTTGAFERSPDVDLDPGTAAYMEAFAGISYAWKNIRAAAQADAGPLNVLAMRVGGNF